GEAPRTLQAQPAFHDDVQVRVRAAEHAVAHVAADDPSAGPQLRGGLLQEPADLLVGYWLSRAHSTAPTWPARSPNRARRTLGRRAGLMNGEDRSVSSMVGATSFHDRVTPPPSTNISGSIALVKLIKARPIYLADRSTTMRACLSPRAAAANNSDAGCPVSFARLA